MTSKTLVWVLATLLILGGCVTTRSPETQEALKNPIALARSLAAARLGCTEKDITVKNTGAFGAELYYVASGCNQETQVNCIRTGSTYHSTDEYNCRLNLEDPSLFVSSLVKNQAAVDLKCAAKDVQISQVGGTFNADDSTFVANGCSRVASYHCEDTSNWWRRANFECKKMPAKG